MCGPDFASSTHRGIASVQDLCRFKFTLSSQVKKMREIGGGSILSNHRCLLPSDMPLISGASEWGWQVEHKACERGLLPREIVAEGGGAWWHLK